MTEPPVASSGSAAVDAEVGESTPAWLLAATLLLTALNLRAVVITIGPLLREVQAGLGLSDTMAGVLTTLPVVVFGLFGLLGARVAQRLGVARAVVVALALVTLGTGLRGLAPSGGWLLAISLVAFVGIAVGNVLAPVLVKAWFPARVGRATAWYTTALAFGTAVPAAATVPLALALGGWRPGLSVWALPGVVALVAAFAVVGYERRARRHAGDLPTSGADPVAGAAEGSDAAPANSGDERAGSRGCVGEQAAVAIRSRVRRHPTTWALAAFFGLQSLEAYTVAGWLPAILRDAGVSPARAGAMLAVVMLLGAPIALMLPPLAAWRDDQRPFVVVLVAASFAGYLGLLLAPAAAPLLWSLLLGVGLGAFPLALLLIALRAGSPSGTAELSTLVQGLGYLMAAAGPVTIGIIHDRTGGWDLPIGVLLVLLVPKLLAGLLAARPGCVDEAAGPG